MQHIRPCKYRRPWEFIPDNFQHYERAKQFFMLSDNSYRTTSNIMRESNNSLCYQVIHTRQLPSLWESQTILYVIREFLPDNFEHYERVKQFFVLSENSHQTISYVMKEPDSSLCFQRIHTRQLPTLLESQIILYVIREFTPDNFLCYERARQFFMFSGNSCQTTSNIIREPNNSLCYQRIHTRQFLVMKEPKNSFCYQRLHTR